MVPIKQQDRGTQRMMVLSRIRRTWTFAVMFLFLLLPALSYAQRHSGLEIRMDGQVYDLVTYLGKGSYAEVYEAVPREAGKSPVAVKIFNDSQTARNTLYFFERLYDDSQESRRFLRVTRPKLGQLIKKDGKAFSFYMATSELGLRQSLNDTLNLRLNIENFDAKNPTSVQQVQALHIMATQLAEGLAHLAKLGLAHGDIKPQNILFLGDRSQEVSPQSIIQGTHRVVIADLENVAEQPEPYTSLYRAPERGVGLQNGTLVSDHYSLAITMIRLLGLKIGAAPLTRDQFLTELTVMMNAWEKNVERLPPGETRTQLRELVDYINYAREPYPESRRQALLNLAPRNSILPKNFVSLHSSKLMTTVMTWSSVLVGGCAVLKWLMSF